MQRKYTTVALDVTKPITCKIARNHAGIRRATTLYCSASKTDYTLF